MNKLITVGSAFLLCISALNLHAQEPTALSTVRQEGVIGTIVPKVAGRVTAGSGIFRNTAFFQDRTGGMAVFNSQFKNGVKVGDSVVIEQGQLAEFQPTTGSPGTGLLQLTGTDLRFTVVPTPVAEPTPRVTTIPLITESTEGQLVRLRRVTFQSVGSFQGETNYTVLDASLNEIQVRIDGGTEIAINALQIPTGEIDLVGLVSQFRGTFQIQPRFSTDIGLAPVEEDTVKKSRTIDISTWNLEWFGTPDTTRGPSDKVRQRETIGRIMDSTQADIYALQEIVSDEELQKLSDSLDGNYARIFASDITSDQKLAYIYNTTTVSSIQSALAVNGGAQAWANGRFPFRLSCAVTVDGTLMNLHVFNIHAKATDSATATEDYTRRKVDAETFHAYLNDFYRDSNVVVLGDFNDRIIGTNVTTETATCYAAFDNDKTNWTILTRPLEEKGLASYVGFNRSFLDHIIISNELNNSHYRTYLEAPTAYISSYSSTVSDHVPVTTRIYPKAVTSVNETIVSSAVRVSPMPLHTTGFAEIVIEKDAQLHVELVDMFGNSMSLAHEFATAQVRVLPLPISQVVPGTYSLRTSIGNATTTTQVIVVR